MLVMETDEQIAADAIEELADCLSGIVGELQRMREQGFAHYDAIFEFCPALRAFESFAPVDDLNRLARKIAPPSV